MKIDANRLQEMANLANGKAIMKALKAEGYSLAEKDARYRKLGLQVLFRASAIHSEWVEDAAGRKAYQCSLYENVPGTEPETTFTVITINEIDRKRDISVPYDLLIFVRNK